MKTQANKGYTEAQVVKLLNNNQGVRVYSNSLEVQVSNSYPIGIHTRGKIDFLTNHCGYHKNTVSKFEDPSEKENIKSFNQRTIQKNRGNWA